MIIDQFRHIDGYFYENKFIMRGILGHAVYERYNSEELLSLARLIHDDEQLYFVIDETKKIQVLIEFNSQLKNELYFIAKQLEEQL